MISLAQESLPCQPVVITDPDLLIERAELLGLPLTTLDVTRDPIPESGSPGCLAVLPVVMPARVLPGKPDSANAGYVLETLKLAVDGCLNGEFNAMVTGPVHKATINQAGHCFSGHTEFIAAACGGAQPVMMLINKELRVALVTTHVPLSEVSSLITAERLEQTLAIVDADLRRKFDLEHPRLLVCGLNPHAGEGGYLGREEIEIMEPVIEKCRSSGLNILGPVPADTAFTPESLREIDCVVAMYHDQGLPALKARGFGETVNITLGLPILRTSVDHGTAFPLAGTGRASSASLRAALNCACQLSRHAGRP